jgi:alpha-amylase
MRNMFVFLAILLFFSNCRQPNQGNSVSSTTSKPQEMNRLEPEWAHNAVLYECNVRQFSPDGNFKAVRTALPRLKSLGIDILWLMPIHPIGKEHRKGKLGSPYSVQDYYAINPDYGTADDLKGLIGDAHNMGMKVILDWVPNHTSWDAVWMKTHPEYYTKVNGNFTVPLNENGGSTGWDDVADLDYSNPGLRHAMIGAMQFWLKDFDIDGFRVDMAGLVPNDFWAMARPSLDSVKQVFMLAEWQDEPGHFNSCFSANYGWKWKDVTKDIANGRQTAQSLDTLLQYLNNFYPKGYTQLYFTQNHDENTWNGSELDLYGPAADAFNVLMFTWQGMPMLYNGQEDGLNQRLAFFEKDPIQWKEYAKAEFFQNLCALKHNNKSLQTGLNGGVLEKIETNDNDAIYAFTRNKDDDRVIVVLNLSKENKNVTLHPKDELLGAYLNVFGANSVQVTKDMNLYLKPWEYLVLTNK